jgi:hypothetical protein
MSLKLVFEGQAVKSEMVVLVLEKWNLHPQMEEVRPDPDLNDLARDTRVVVPEEEHERARDILWGESEIERAGF